MHTYIYIISDTYIIYIYILYLIHINIYIYIISDIYIYILYLIYIYIYYIWCIYIYILYLIHTYIYFIWHIYILYPIRIYIYYYIWYIYIYIHIWEIPYMNSRVQLSQLQTSQNSIRPSAVAQDGSLDLAELHTGRLSGDHGWPAGWSWGCGSKIIGKFPMIYGKHMENLWKFPKSRFSICFPYINGHATGT